MSKIGISKEALKEMIRDNVKMLYRKALEKATVEEIYQAAAFTVRDIISENWIKTHDEYYEKDEKVVYYLSMEFLMGRFLGNGLINLEMFEEVKEVFDELGVDFNMVEDAEPGPGLGNGGLGRLAAWIHFPHCPCRHMAAASAIIMAFLNSALKTVIRLKCRITGWKTVTPGA